MDSHRISPPHLSITSQRGDKVSLPRRENEKYKDTWEEGDRFSGVDPRGELSSEGTLSGADWGHCIPFAYGDRNSSSYLLLASSASACAGSGANVVVVL